MRRRHWKNIAVVACVGFVGACWFAVRFYEAARRAPQATADQPTAVQGPALPGASAASRRTDREEALDPRAAQVLRQRRQALAPVLDGDSGGWGPAKMGEWPAGAAGPKVPAMAPVSVAVTRKEGSRDAAADRKRAAARLEAAAVRVENCRPRKTVLSIGSVMVDLVVVIDTSYGMEDHLAGVRRWLSALEPMLREAGLDYRLHVIGSREMLDASLPPDYASPRWVAPQRGTHTDVTVHADALEVLLGTHGHGGSPWFSGLRPDADVHLVVVTDKDPSPDTTRTFVQRLTALAKGRLGTPDDPAFSFHALLGMEAKPSAWTLPPSAPLEQGTCGTAPGLPYQRLVQQRGGLRGSVCHAESFEAFTRALVARALNGFDPADRCSLRLPPSMADLPITSVRALPGPSNPTTNGSAPRPLKYAREQWICATAVDAYSLGGGSVRLCPYTCDLLEQKWLTRVEVVANECRP